jgi:uncharacterized protein (DUF58 family)
MYILPALLLVMIWLWPSIWARVVKPRIHVELTVERKQVSRGEEVPVTVRISNRSWLPCPYARLSIELPSGLSAHPDRAEGVLWCETYLFLRQEIELKLACYGRQRGVQSIRTVSLHLNDGLGLRDLILLFDTAIDVFVVPGLLPMSEVKVPIQNFLGRYEVVRWLHPDEAMLRGIREYRRGDALKHIAWQATAKSGKWMTKEFSSSTETSVRLVLNAQLFEPHWIGTTVEEFDALCDLVCTWAYGLQALGARLTFFSNCTISRDPRRQLHGEQRAEGIRSLLGRAHPYANGPFEQVLQFLLQKRDDTSPIIIFSSFLTPTQIRQIAYLAKSGCDMTLVCGPNSTGQHSLSGLVHVVSNLRKERAVGE